MPKPSRLCIACGAVFFVLVSVPLSTLAQAPAFAAASIKPNKKPDTSFAGGWCRGIDTKIDPIPEGGGLGAAVGLQFSLSPPGLGRCNLNSPLKHLIAMAYERDLLKTDERILGGPDWILDKYRIDAVAPNPASVTAAEVHRML